MTRRPSDVLLAYAMVAPSVIYLGAVVAYPLIDTLLLSFTSATLRPVVHWVGLDNFRALLTLDFAAIVLRTLVWTGISVGLKILFGLAGAILLNAHLPGRSVFRILIMPPWIVPTAIAAFMWGWMYSGQFGMVSGLLQRWGVTQAPIPFLAFPRLAFAATIVTDVWVGLPLVILYFLAALQSVPEDLLEAAWVDGAARFSRLRHIVLPLLSPAIASMTLLAAMFTFRSFDAVWILTAGGPSDATTTMVVDIYRVGFARYRYGEAAARAVVLCLILSLLSSLFLLRRLRSPRSEAV